MCLLIIYNDYDTIWIVSFILMFSQIQIFESIAWANMDHINNNKAINSLLIVLLMLQPIINTIYAYKKSKNKKRENKKLLYLLAMLIGSLLYLIYLNKNIIIKPGINGHLTWIDYTSNYIFNNIFIVIIYLTGLLYPLTYIDNNIHKIVLILFGISTSIYSSMNYMKTKEVSSYWCYIATLMMMVFALLKILTK